MRIVQALVGSTLIAAAPEQPPAALPAPGVSPIRVEVETYAGGGCAIVTLRRPNGSAALVLDDRCHGWSIENCDAMLFVRRAGIVADGGTVIRAPDSPPLDVPAAINAALERRSPAAEYLHLRFGRSRCTEAGIELPFDGSLIGRGVSGSAGPLAGVVRVAREGEPTVDLQAR